MKRVFTYISGIFNERQISVTTLDFMKRFEEHQRTLVNQRPQAPNEFMNSISGKMPNAEIPLHRRKESLQSDRETFFQQN